jgi:hypothetical protein
LFFSKLKFILTKGRDEAISRINFEFLIFSPKWYPSEGGQTGQKAPSEEKVKMIVAQQKFLSEIFAEHPKFCPESHLGSGQPRTELCSGTGLHFDICIFNFYNTANRKWTSDVRWTSDVPNID